jgi:hypothetical protein
MRLPQSISQSPLRRRIHSLTVGVALVIGTLIPQCVAAGAPQLQCSPSNLRFGFLDLGHTESLVVSVTNTGESSVTLSSVAVSGSEFSISPLNLPMTLAAGQSLDVNVNFTPQSTGWVGGTIRFYSNASNSTLALQTGGTGTNNQSVIANPSVVSFGSVSTGSHSTVPVTITNTSTAKVYIAGAQATGSGFAESGGTFPVTLSAGQSVSLNVTYTPSGSGEAGGSLFLYGPALNIPLTGNGNTAAGQLVVAPSPLNFGNVMVGQSATELMSVTATGAAVTVYSATSGNSQFALEGATFPLTLNPGQSVSYDVAFAPQNAGAESGALSFNSNASNPIATETLSGSGQAPNYSVNLSWNADQNVTGYNVYRATSAAGTYVKINSALNPTTTYVDNSVTAGQTYYYAATSVNPAGQESGKSTPPVQAAVP